jgi:signal transduction histidine kinase/FixJ family two-component response regulator
MSQPTIESPLERYVLCVDDDPEFLKSLEVFLPGRVNQGGQEGFWYRFVFLPDAAETLSVLRELVNEGSIVAMLISDQQMPSMKGTQLLSEAREIAPHCLRVLLTGHSGIEAAITAINERLLDRYLTKPIENENDFTLSVQELLQRFEMQRVIDAQASALQDLYGFANAINAMDRLDRMVHCVAAFIRTTLEGSGVWVVVGDGSDNGHCVAIDRTGARSVPDSDRMEALMRILSSGAPTPGKGVRDLPAEWRSVLGRQELDLGEVAVCADLTSGQSRLGLIVAGRRGRSFTEPERSTLEYIADTASIAIHKQITWSELQGAYRLTRDQAVSLEEANRKLTTLDRMKSEFLRFISHELRTPLSYMSAIGILERPIEPAQQAEMVAIVRRGYQRLERFIFKGLDYLDWCGAGRIESTDVTDLRVLLLGAAGWLAVSAGREVELELVTPDGPCPIAMPEERVEEVVRILLDNAVKFSDDKPRVRIDLRSAAGIVTLAVADHGRGFPPEVAQDILRPFTVMDTLHHREGTALNLARASAMVEAHGGRINAKSEGNGLGATFTIELPVALHVTGEAQPAAIDPPDEVGEDSDSRRAA